MFDVWVVENGSRERKLIEWEIPTMSNARWLATTEHRIRCGQDTVIMTTSDPAGFEIMRLGGRKRVAA